MEREKVGFVGGGQMATALLAGAIQAGVLKVSNTIVAESSESRRQFLQQKMVGLKCVSSASELASCSTLIIALKPQVLREVGRTIGTSLSGDRLWISVAAGVSLSELSVLLGSNRIIRVMPNTPAQVGAGASGLAAAAQVLSNDMNWAEQLMNSVGRCFRVQESQLSAVTGIAGSSPAYIYMIIEAMADGGVLGGLPRDVAQQLAAQSVLGAAKMVLESGLHPGQLKDQVTSPAGTTIAAIRKLEAAGVRSALMEAVHAATVRSQELESSGTK